MKWSNESNWFLAVALAVGLCLGGFWGYWIGYDRGTRKAGADLRRHLQQTNLWADYQAWVERGGNTGSNTSDFNRANR